MSEPTPYELWKQAGEDGERYRELMVEHGYLIPLKPGENPEPLPCGWPHNRLHETDPADDTVQRPCDHIWRDDGAGSVECQRCGERE